MAGNAQERPHSAAFFGPARNYWWNQDHLQLIASRLHLGAARRVLDVGCGQGLWGRTLEPILSPQATLVGVDREPDWISFATRVAGELGLSSRFRYQQGTAEALPFADASFDLVTCQTVLMHLADPGAGIKEMLRVLEPGGVLLAAEPSNRASTMVQSSVTADAPVEEITDLVRFVVTCERGKLALGEGDNSIGDLLPGLFAHHAITDIEVFLSDKAATLFPPYRSSEQRVLRDHLLEQAERRDWGWTRTEAERFYLAGGGTVDAFDASWKRRLAENDAVAAALLDGTFHSAGATILYAVAGRCPR